MLPFLYIFNMVYAREKYKISASVPLPYRDKNTFVIIEYFAYLSSYYCTRIIILLYTYDHITEHLLSHYGDLSGNL